VKSTAPSPLPPTSKGERTRQLLIEAAKRTFERSGSYNNTRISDISKDAGVAYGSFYTYFKTKEEIFAVVAEETTTRLYDVATRGYDCKPTAVAVGAANETFIDCYRRYAKLLQVVEQAAVTFPEFEEMLRSARTINIGRVTDSLRRWQADGRIKANLDPQTTAQALVSMNDRFGYVWFVINEPISDELAVPTLNHIWLSSLGIRR
jgi:AcrR family transcriptional regulator